MQQTQPISHAINAITTALSAFLSHPAVDAETNEALLSTLVEEYNQNHPDDAITPGVKCQGSRWISTQTRYSDLLLRALDADPSGGAFMALRLPELKQSLQALSLSLDVPTDALESALGKHYHLRCLISQVEAAAPYQLFISAVQSIYSAATAIQPAICEQVSFSQLAEDYPEMADTIYRELKQCSALTLTEKTGNTELNTLTEQLNEWVVRVSDEEELLSAALAAPNGFTLFATLVENDAAASYFSLLCKTPARAVLFQDKLSTVYPGQHTRRRNDRQHESRINNSPFPYSLLDLEISDNGRRISQGNKNTDMIPADARNIRILASVRDLEAGELIKLLTCMRLVIADWETLTAPLLAQPAQALLSYQPELVNLPALVSNKPISLPWDQLTTHKLTNTLYTALEQEAGNNPPPRNWVAEQHLPSILNEMEEQSLIRSDGTALVFNPKHGTPSQLSTEPRVKADLLYLARAEQADKIHAALDSWKTRETVRTREWLAEHMRNSARLKREMIDHAFWGTVTGMRYGAPHRAFADLPDDAVSFYQEHDYLLGFATRYDKKATDQKSALLQPTYCQRAYENAIWIHDDKKSYHQGFPLNAETIHLSEGENFIDDKIGHLPRRNIRCAFSDAPAEFFFSVRLEGKFAVSAFTGVHWRDLPPLLRTLGDEPYLGNSILQRTDPLLDTNKWTSRRPFTVTIGISMIKLNELRLTAGLPKITKNAIKAFIKKIRDKHDD